jgi:protocatechuate 3,4-dioxygenase beta subunit
MALTRRRLLLSLSLLTGVRPAGLLASQGLERFVSSGRSCAPDEVPTPAVTADGTFRDDTAERSRLAGDAATFVLAGTVSGLFCGAIEGARVDLWHAGAAGDDAARHRGYQWTDEGGAFRFETVVPGSVSGRAPRFSLRVRVKGRADFRTALFLPGDTRNAADPAFRPELLLTVRSEGDRYLASFPVLLDL